MGMGTEVMKRIFSTDDRRHGQLDDPDASSLKGKSIFL